MTLAGIMDENILPPNGLIQFNIPDGSVSSLDFLSASIERYQIDQNITENDGTLTWLMEVVMDGITQFSCEARSADVVITMGQSQGENSIFLNGEFLFPIDCTVTTIVWLEETVRYTNNTVSIQEQNVKFINITTFWYCDGFRCYTFNSSKLLFERSGPTGKLFTSKGIALYSISSPINSDIENILENPTPIISSPVITVTPTLTSIASLNSTTQVISIVPTSTPIPTLETSIIGLSSISPTPTPSNVPVSSSSFVSIASDIITTLVSISPTPARATSIPTISSMLLISPTSIKITPTPTPDEITPTRDVPQPCSRKTKFSKTKPYTKTSRPLSKLKTGFTKTGTKFTGTHTKSSRSKTTDTFRTKYYTAWKYPDITKSESDTTKSSSIHCKTRDSKKGTRKTSRTMGRTDISTTIKTKSRSSDSNHITFDKETVSQSTKFNSKTRGTSIKSPNKHKETLKRTSHSTTRSKSGTKTITEEIVLLIKVPFVDTYNNRHCKHLEEMFKMVLSTRLERLLFGYIKQFLLVSNYSPPHVQKSHQTKKMLEKTNIQTRPSFDCNPETNCSVNRHLPLNQVNVLCNACMDKWEIYLLNRYFPSVNITSLMNITCSAVYIQVIVIMIFVITRYFFNRNNYSLQN